MIVKQSSIKQMTSYRSEEVYSPSNNAATVLLQNDNHMEQGNKHIPTLHAYLERYSSEGGSPEKIVLSKNSFIIGRDSKLAQYIEQVVGVSRAHVELTLSADGCTIKDLGSRNGTKLNSEWVAPYKEYPLQAGEIFVIAGVSYKYCVS
ncbi:FHA domain protein [compost metagenome]